MDAKPRVFVVDDDPVVLGAISRVLRAHGFTVEEYSSAVAFLERLPCDGVACALVDLKLPDLNGLDVQKTMARKGLPLPIVFLSGLADVPSTAHAMREGAIDFLVKPLDEARLLDAITRACTRAVAWRQEGAIERERDLRLARLTKREREVCDLVARGLLNRQIAYELGIVEKTIKVHRARVMRKLQVDSVAALVRLLTNPPAQEHHGA